MNDNLLHKVRNYFASNNIIHLNKTDGSKDSKHGIESTRPWLRETYSIPGIRFPAVNGANHSWLRTSLLLKYLTESQSSQLFADINGNNVTEVDFHVNATFDYINEIGFWDDGDVIDPEWWFRKSENDTDTIMQVLDQVKNIACSSSRNL